MEIKAIYNNIADVPLPLAVWLATDEYKYGKYPNEISTTTIMKSPRYIIGSRRVQFPQDFPEHLHIPTSNGLFDVMPDIQSKIKARIGTAIHSSAELSWTDPKFRTIALELLGYSKDTTDNVVINPEPTQKLSPFALPVYLEQRAYRELDNFVISGQYDFVVNGNLHDIKTTSTYVWQSGCMDEKYILQGSIYRWLNPEIITDEFMDICFIFTDWQKNRYMSDPRNYPSSQIISRSFKLHSAAFVQSYVEDRVRTLIILQDVPEKDLPLCTDKELWRKPDTFKYYKNPQKQTKSTANFDNLNDANRRFLEDGAVGLVKTVKGGVSACLYCSAFTVCTQKDRLIESGELKI